MKKCIILAVLFLSLSSCLDDIYPPLIITGQVTNIDNDGSVFHANITDLGKKSILEFGFVWDTVYNPIIGKADKYVFPDKPSLGNYSLKMSAYLLPKTTYYVRAFIRTTDITTYGESMAFKSFGGKAPVISSISPLLGNIGQTITIIGKYLSSKNSVVKFNQVTTLIKSVNQDSMLVIVPEFQARSAIISVTTPEATIIYKDSFQLFTAIINDFTPKTGTYGDEITIKGKNFLKNPNSLVVLFDKQITPSKIVDDETIKFNVSVNLTKSSCSIGVVMNNIYIISTDKFLYKE
jgi:hypothetical protein